MKFVLSFSAVAVLAVFGAGCGGDDDQCARKAAVENKLQHSLRGVSCANYMLSNRSCSAAREECLASNAGGILSLQDEQSYCENNPHLYEQTCDGISLDEELACTEAFTATLRRYAGQFTCDAKPPAPALPAECTALRTSCPEHLEALQRRLAHAED